ncbi:MAG: sodium:solute symporter, partial [Candidatus Meridianibacter frigidus]
GEVYTSFTFLAASGWAYANGAAAFYILCYGTVGFILGYFMVPAIWRVGKERGLLTAPDFFAFRYDNRLLGRVLGIFYFFTIVPYVALQLTGIQILLTLAGYGAYNPATAVVVALLLTTVFVFTAGLRGTAWASVIKDILVLAAVIFAGVAIPVHFFGSPAAVFSRLAEAKPQWLTLQTVGLHTPAWFVSTVILNGVGFFMGPHSIAAVYAARDENTLRRNMIFLPFYQVVLLLVFFAGFAALLIVPGLKGAAVDQSFMLVVQRFYPAWVLGLVAGAGCLAALVPVSAQLLGAASALSKNLVGDIAGWKAEDPANTLCARILIVVLAVLALAFWRAHIELGELLLLYYNFITQMLPGFVFGLVWKRANAWGVSAGIAAGLCTALWLALAGVSWFGLNVGLIGLIVNIGVCVAVTLLTTQNEKARS